MHVHTTWWGTQSGDGGGGIHDIVLMEVCMSTGAAGAGVCWSGLLGSAHHGGPVQPSRKFPGCRAGVCLRLPCSSLS